MGNLSEDATFKTSHTVMCTNSKYAMYKDKEGRRSYKIWVDLSQDANSDHCWVPAEKHMPTELISFQLPVLICRYS